MCYTPKLPQSRSECVTGTICSLFLAPLLLCQRPVVQRRWRLALLVRGLRERAAICAHTHKPTHTDRQALADVYQLSNTLQHFSAPLDGTAPPSSTSCPPVPPSTDSRSRSSFPCVSSSCVGGRLESPQSTTRISRSISETISFSHLFYMVHSSIFLSSLPLPLTCSLWLIYVFTLCPSSHSLLLGI